MLDYAANTVVHWPMDQIRAALEPLCQRKGLDVHEVLNDFLGSDRDPEFWQDVKTNLQAVGGSDCGNVKGFMNVDSAIDGVGNYVHKHSLSQVA
jgi:hypothetical protein